MAINYMCFKASINTNKRRKKNWNIEKNKEIVETTKQNEWQKKTKPNQTHRKKHSATDNKKEEENIIENWPLSTSITQKIK